MKVVGIIQARMGSTRLENKVMLPLGNTVLLDYVYQRSMNIPLLDEVVIATSSSTNDDVIEDWAKKNGVHIYRGSENDLMLRYVDCAKKFHADYIVRVTGDCPFLSFEMANKLIHQTLEQKAEYGYVASTNIPIGLKVSVIKTELLLMLNEFIEHPTYREHITLYIDEHLNQFSTTSLEPFEYMREKNYRITCDTKADYIFLNKLVKHLGYNTHLLSEDIIQFLDRNPQIVAINNSIQQKRFSVKREF